MSLPVPPTNSDGSLREYTGAEITSMGIQALGVRDGSHPTHRRRPDNCQIQREFFCAFDALEAFICYLLGTTVTYTSAITGKLELSRLLPQTYPGLPQIAAVAIDEATGHQLATPYLDANGVPVYTKWRVKVTYQNVPYQLVDDADIDFEYKRYVIELPSIAQPESVTLQFHVRNDAIC